MTKRMYIDQDKKANGIKRKYPIIGYDYLWIYLRTMRKIEYYNSKTGVNKLLKWFNVYRLRKLSVKTGISIPPNTFERGLTLYHWGSIVVNPRVNGGKNVTIQSDVNISENVILGDNVYIAPGVKILENVQIAEGVILGANAVVTHDIMEPYTTWVGIPAKKISNNGYYRHVDEGEGL